MKYYGVLAVGWILITGFQWYNNMSFLALWLSMALLSLTWTTINVLQERFLEDWLFLAKGDKTRVYKCWISRIPSCS